MNKKAAQAALDAMRRAITKADLALGDIGDDKPTAEVKNALPCLRLHIREFRDAVYQP